VGRGAIGGSIATAGCRETMSGLRSAGLQAEEGAGCVVANAAVAAGLVFVALEVLVCTEKE
jgi:hypothetical protein